MKQIIKGIRLIGLSMLIGILFSAVNVNAQSPADDPGIGGPGSPTIGVGGDSGPVVPFDNSLNLLFIATTMGGIYMANKKGIIALR